MTYEVLAYVAIALLFGAMLSAAESVAGTVYIGLQVV
jgi:hypothetical protein